MKQPPVARLVYTVTDLGVALGGLSERTVYRLLDKGEIPKPIKLGRRIVWAINGPTGIEAWLAAGAVSAANWAAMSQRMNRRRAG